MTTSSRRFWTDLGIATLIAVAVAVAVHWAVRWIGAPSPNPESVAVTARALGFIAGVIIGFIGLVFALDDL